MYELFPTDPKRGFKDQKEKKGKIQNSSFESIQPQVESQIRSIKKWISSQDSCFPFVGK